MASRKRKGTGKKENVRFGRNYRYLLAGISIALIVFLLCLFLYQTVSAIRKLNEHSHALMSADYNYHFIVNSGHAGTYFEEELLRGMEEAAKEHNIILEVSGYNSAFRGNDLEFENWVSFIHPDGAIVGGKLSRTLPGNLENVDYCFINDEPDSNVSLYVGPDNYQQGWMLAGELKKLYPEESKNIVILFPWETNGRKGKLKGFMEGISDCPNFHIVQRLAIEKSLLTSMGIAEREMLQFEDVDYFVCLDENILAGAVRAVLDLNRVNKVDVCGIGISDEIREYLENGIVDIAIDPGAFEMGRIAVETLFQYKQRKESAVIYTSDTTVVG